MEIESVRSERDDNTAGGLAPTNIKRRIKSNFGSRTQHATSLNTSGNHF